MSYTKEHYENVEPAAPGLYFLRDALECDNFGISYLEVGAGWTGLEHDHAEDGQEEVYLLVDGAGELTVEGETVALEPGEAVRVPADATRQLAFEADSRMVIAGAP